jgi:predicted nucleic-acid-binding protein
LKRAVDTNVLVRFLVRDNKEQAYRALTLFKDAQSRKSPLHVSALVLLETIWVLDSVYGCSREEILDAVEKLLSINSLEFDAAPAVEEFCSAARNMAGELDDLLIGTVASSEGCETVLTFDKSAAGTGYFTLLK